MKLSRIQIENFRNFAKVDIAVGNNLVILGENKIGKSNFLFALRLLLDPSLPDTTRCLREEDFWDGITDPLSSGEIIRISVDIADFEDNVNQLALLAEHLVQTEPMVSRLTYEWRPKSRLSDSPQKSSDYEFVIYGGDRRENLVNYQVRQRLAMDLFPAMRDCEGDLLRWTRSPLRPLLDQSASDVPQSALDEIAEEVNESTEKLTKIDEVRKVTKSIEDKVIDMMGKSQALETALRFSPTDASKLIRALRIYIDGGKRGIGEASLGSANLLYFALKMLEYEQMVKDDERDHTFWAIEEPEAHLHPNLQRLIFRNYLRPRSAGPAEQKNEASTTVLMTTHSPHIACVTPLRDIVLLRQNMEQNATEAISTAEIELGEADVVDIERYLDVNRCEIFFAKGVILVEGIAECFLIPVLAKNNGYDLEEHGIIVCSIAGTNFLPYLTLLGPNGLDIPVAALTDYDPQKPKNDGTKRDALGPNRVVDSMVYALVDNETWEESDYDTLLAMAPELGVFVNNHTLEVDLFYGGLCEQITQTMSEVSDSDAIKNRAKTFWQVDEKTWNDNQMLKDIESIGKGRFAQRLASIIEKSKTKKCPKYILDGIKYVIEKSQIK